MSKELIFKALRHEELNEYPWVPFAGVHAGKLKGYNAEEMLRNPDHIVESLKEVAKLYMSKMPISSFSLTTGDLSLSIPVNEKLEKTT